MGNRPNADFKKDRGGGLDRLSQRRGSEEVILQLNPEMRGVKKGGGKLTLHQGNGGGKKETRHCQRKREVGRVLGGRVIPRGGGGIGQLKP